LTWGVNQRDTQTEFFYQADYFQKDYTEIVVIVAVSAAIKGEISLGLSSATGSDVWESREKRPLLQSSDIQKIGVSAEDQLRANVYGLLARVLAEPPSSETLEILRGLIDADDGSELGKAMAQLGDSAVKTVRGRAEEEYTLLFYGAGAGGEIHPYGSFYRTGFIYEQPLSDLRDDMGELGIAPSGFNSEPEDHIAFLCELMHGLITGTYGAPADIEAQKRFFNRHLAPWAVPFFDDLATAETSALYVPVGLIGSLFVSVESTAFAMAV